MTAARSAGENPAREYRNPFFPLFPKAFPLPSTSAEIFAAVFRTALVARGVGGENSSNIIIFAATGYRRCKCTLLSKRACVYFCNRQNCIFFEIFYKKVLTFYKRWSIICYVKFIIGVDIRYLCYLKEGET